MTDDTDGESGAAMNLDDVLRKVIAQADPVPPEVTRYAREAYALRTLDTELADITWDSWVDEPVTTRGSGSRLLTFGPVGAQDTQLHVEVVGGETGFEVTGLIEPAGAREIEVIWRGGSVNCPVDEAGRFTADLPNVRSLRLRLRGDGSSLATGWVPIG
jgi:hypothetical protein